MKKILFMAVSLLVLTSCSSNIYYQVCKVKCDNMEVRKNAVTYEDEFCKLSYNFWTDGGNSGFLFENKTDYPIYIDLANSFFIKNNIAYDYFLERTFSKGSSNSLSLSNTATMSGDLQDNLFAPTKTVSTFAGDFLINSVGFSNAKKRTAAQSQSVSFKEKKVVIVPAHASKIIAEYAISKDLFRSCDNLLYPKKKQIKAITFSEDKSPVVFSNSITYRMGDNGASNEVIVNRFYVSEIKNISRKYEIGKSKTENCDGVKITEQYMKDYSVDKFYIMYMKNSSVKH